MVFVGGVRLGSGRVSSDSELGDSVGIWDGMASSGDFCGCSWIDSVVSGV